MHHIKLLLFVNNIIIDINPQLRPKYFLGVVTKIFYILGAVTKMSLFTMKLIFFVR